MIKYLIGIILIVVFGSCLSSYKASNMGIIEKALYEFYDSSECKKVTQNVILGYQKVIQFDTLYSKGNFIFGKISDLNAKTKEMQNQVANTNFNKTDISIPLKNFKIYQFAYDNGKSKDFIPIAISDENGNFKINIKRRDKLPLYFLFSNQSITNLNGLLDVLVINSKPISQSYYPH